MASIVPAASLLEQRATDPPSASASDEQRAQAERNKRHLDLALQHAHLIQHQKDTQAQILKHIEGLADFPRAASLTRQDAHAFTRLASIFQPSDFDALVEERRAGGKCGYALCGNAPRSSQLGASAAWKLPAGAADWCGDVCARKAVSVKAQLSEVPAWERAPGQQPDVVLHEDDRAALGLGGIAADGAAPTAAARRAADRAELAAERGEKPVSLKPRQVMTERVVERPTSASPRQAVVAGGLASSTAIEGYEPMFSGHRVQGQGMSPGEDAGEDDYTGIDLDQQVQSHDNQAEDEEDQWRDMFANLSGRGDAALARASDNLNT